VHGGGLLGGVFGGVGGRSGLVIGRRNGTFGFWWGGMWRGGGGGAFDGWVITKEKVGSYKRKWMEQVRSHSGNGRCNEYGI